MSNKDNFYPLRNGMGYLANTLEEILHSSADQTKEAIFCANTYAHNNPWE